MRGIQRLESSTLGGRAHLPFQMLKLAETAHRLFPYSRGSAHQVLWPLFEGEPRDLEKGELYRIHSGKSVGRGTRTPSVQKLQWPELQWQRLTCVAALLAVSTLEFMLVAGSSSALIGIILWCGIGQCSRMLIL